MRASGMVCSSAHRGGARPQVHDIVLAPGDEAIAVPFEFVNPLGSGRDIASRHRLTGTNKARRGAPITGADGTPNHAPVMRDLASRLKRRNAYRRDLWDKANPTSLTWEQRKELEAEFAKQYAPNDRS